MSKRNRKGWGTLFFDEIFGTNSKTPFQKEEQRRERENRGDKRRWSNAQKQMKRDDRKNRKYYGN